MVGLEPWGATAAADLAAAGLGALHLLGDPAAAGAVRAALAKIARGCAVTTGALSIAADRSLVLDDARWDLVVACLPGDDLLALQSVARFAQAASVPSISAHLDGAEAVLGPAVVPGETACWECCRLRRLACSDHPEIEHALHAALLDRRPIAHTAAYLPPMPAILGHTLALAVVDLLASPGAHPLRGRILVQDLLRMESEVHAVIPMPRCEVCGGAFLRGDAPPEGNGRDIADAQSPEDLRRMLEGVVDPRTGIVRRLFVHAAVSTLELPAMASAVRSRHTDGRPACHACEPVRQVGSGKGETALGAMVSAVGEAVERYSATRFHPRTVIHAPVAEMEGDFLAPADLCPYADGQYDEPGFPFARLSPRTPIDWVRGFWLDTRAPVLVPALTTYLHHHAPADAYFCEVTSNGLAGGPTLDAAAVRAVLELCERDTFMISWLARRPGRRVILDGSVGAGVREAARQLEDEGVRVELYLLDVGLGIPVVACAGYGDGERWPGAMLSISAHLCPRAAIAGALFEQGHFGPYLCRRVAEGRPIPARPEDVRTLEDHALYYMPRHRASAFAFLGAGGEVRAADLPDPEGAPIDVLCRRIAAAGLRVAIADVTSPDLADTPFRVARAQGAGFQQIHFGHRLARLGNPRLCAMAPNGINPDPHPMA
jgi:ribosomal protein S12 methylthiotransferase accessory factor